MSYYWFNKEEVLQKAKEKYNNCGSKEKAAEYYWANKDVLKGKAKNRYKDLSEEEKKAKKGYSKNRYKEIIIIKKQIYFSHMKMHEQTLKFGDIVVEKKIISCF